MADHFWGPLYTTLAAIPHMRKSSGGRVVNISSIGGKIGVPHLAPYCASKFALTGLSESLRGADQRSRIASSPCDEESGSRAYSGWQSPSRWAPSRLTTLTNRAAAENNELPPRP